MLIIVLLIIIFIIIYIVYRNNMHLKENFNGDDIQSGSCLSELIAGNILFAKDPKYIKERQAQLKAQTPCIVVVSCSDSRSPVPIISNQLNLGRIFEIKVAGNSLGPDDLESIKIAVTGLDQMPELILVLGHTHCSAVSTALGSLYDVSLRESFPTIINNIMPSIFKVLAKHKLFNVMNITENEGSTNIESSEKLKEEIEYIKEHKDYFVQQSIIQNVIDKANLIAYSFDLKYGETVKAAVYDIETGLINLV